MPDHNASARAQLVSNWLLKVAGVANDPKLNPYFDRYEVIFREAIENAIYDNCYGLWYLREHLIEDHCTICITNGSEQDDFLHQTCQNHDLPWPFADFTGHIYVFSWRIVLSKPSSETMVIHLPKTLVAQTA